MIVTLTMLMMLLVPLMLMMMLLMMLMMMFLMPLMMMLLMPLMLMVMLLVLLMLMVMLLMLLMLMMQVRRSTVLRVDLLTASRGRLTNIPRRDDFRRRFHWSTTTSRYVIIFTYVPGLGVAVGWRLCLLLTVLCYVSSALTNRLAAKNVTKMTYFVSSVINQSIGVLNIQVVISNDAVCMFVTCRA